MISALFTLALLTTAALAAPTCADRCIAAGHCCSGNASSCQRPSCQMGCIVGASSSEAACNATCAAAKGCTFVYNAQTFGMCGSCSNRWLDPATLTPRVLPGREPYWPPGFSLPGCTSCDSVTTECELGCYLAHHPSANPGPPSPTPPPPAPLPPAPWPNTAPGFNFSAVLSSHMVLQQAPAAAAVFGATGGGDGAAVAVTVTPSAGGGAPYTVPAEVGGGRWKALLRPTPDTGRRVTFTITAACTSGCAGSATLLDVVFGDVWWCAGQSNQWLQLRYTYARNSSLAAIQAGGLDNIRLASGDSQSQGLSPTLPPTHPWRALRDAAALPAADADAWDQFSAPCFHFAEALTVQFRAAGKAPPTLGLVGVAIGGSVIEEWVPNEVAAGCYGAQANANGAELNHILWDVMVQSHKDMTIKGWTYYQGENSALLSLSLHPRPRPPPPRLIPPPHTPPPPPNQTRARSTATPSTRRATRASCPRSSAPGAGPGPPRRAPRPPTRPLAWSPSAQTTRRAPRTWRPSAGPRRAATAWCPTPPCPTPSWRTRTTSRTCG